MSAHDRTCVVVGAGHAAVALAAALRQGGWTGPIRLIGEEGGLPYERPPLSKSFLAGEKAPDAFPLRPASFFATHDIELIAARAARLDRDACVVELEDGEEVAYDRLALATGARPVPLAVPGADLAGVHLLRSLADVEAIRADLALTGDGAPVVMVGGGYVGLEAAASLRGLGHDVTVLEAADRVLARVTSPPVSAFFTRLHHEEGVRVETGVEVVGLESDGGGRAARVRTADGGSHQADLVIVGIGVRACAGLAEDAGLEVDRGVVVDAGCRTSDPAVVALGDCARVRPDDGGPAVCLESVPNAREQARAAAATLLGLPRPPVAVPWFWSDQYDLTLQTAGDVTGHGEIVLRGDPGSGRSFAAFHLDDGRLVGADCVARPREFMMTRKLLAAGTSPDPALLADESVEVPEIMARLLTARR
ncbi:FAD-dependent oxidoreductase [Nocardioidaceae bacterium]|nr:FAD-dependent oxidoreductase [Nocardioidaceae bacterium]